MLRRYMALDDRDVVECVAGYASGGSTMRPYMNLRQSWKQPHGPRAALETLPISFERARRLQQGRSWRLP